MTIKIVLLALCLTNIAFTYQLKQVVIISRHNVRAPQMKGDIEKATPHTWPEWDVPLSDLTQKGALLETYMGKYFSQWFQKEGFHHGCPEEKVVVYANERQRTKETAKKFAETAFKKCNVTVQVEKDYFFPAVYESEGFRKKVAAQIESELEEIDLDDAYRMLNIILDIKNSNICEEDLLCDLTEKKNKIVYTAGHQLNVEGPINIANSAVDAFLMAYYEGESLEKIGWGKIKEEDFDTLSKITRVFHNIIFNGTQVCPHHLKPLLKKMHEVFENKSINYALFFGHDAVLTPVMCNLGFKYSAIPNSWEDIPIGSKLVFQKWYDEKDDKYLLKINFIYPTTEQLRSGSEISLENPPKSVVMELSNCATDDNGFCEWSDFLKIFSLL